MKQAVYIKPLTVSLSWDLYSVIKELSDQHCTSMAQVVREILERTFSESTSVEKFNQETAIISSKRER